LKAAQLNGKRMAAADALDLYVRHADKVIFR